MLAILKWRLVSVLARTLAILTKFSWFSVVPQTFVGLVLQGRDCFLPEPFQFISHPITECCTVQIQHHKINVQIITVTATATGVASISQYSNWLQAGQLRGWSLSPGRVHNFLSSMSPRLALGSTKPPI
jgi:hypothetical protein